MIFKLILIPKKMYKIIKKKQVSQEKITQIQIKLKNKIQKNKNNIYLTYFQISIYWVFVYKINLLAFLNLIKILMFKMQIK